MKERFTLKPGKWLCVTRDGERSFVHSDGSISMDLDEYLYVLQMPIDQTSTETQPQSPAGQPEGPPERPASPPGPHST